MKVYLKKKLLGPLVFLIFGSDLPPIKKVNNDLTMYGDDNIYPKT